MAGKWSTLAGRTWAALAGLTWRTLPNGVQPPPYRGPAVLITASAKPNALSVTASARSSALTISLNP